MTLTPTEELRTAASLLRDKATAAIHEGRTTWATGNTLGSKSPVVVDDQEQPSVLIETYAARLERVNSYLALLGPATGLALADWLKDSATLHMPDTECGYCIPSRNPLNLPCPALKVARQLLGGTQ
ncbi:MULTISPECIES: hypothetical protein [unclassified Streptomyces]|uniref:hypothetical protein n=1 Tax=unclassified Streptomyces TaxID=2593676 RepID=UPI002E0DAEFE|nr:hypothetical protein OG466_41340 [Streptomyces sp. NBC_01240]